MKNYERIKNMSVEEMTDYLANCIDTECHNICHASSKTFKETIRKWLESEVENEKP